MQYLCMYVIMNDCFKCVMIWYTRAYLHLKFLVKLENLIMIVPLNAYAAFSYSFVRDKITKSSGMTFRDLFETTVVSK